MSDLVIKLENVTKYYKLYDKRKDRLKEALHPFKKKYHKPYYALKNLNLEIKKGDVLGVVGRNGCGKSTLLKLITGVLQPNEGTISVKGKITALLELGAGFNPEFTGIDNIQFYAKILGIQDKQFEEKLPSIIAFAELGKFLYQPVKTYSSGMKSRLGFAVAVHVDPEILILDEVLAVGDALFKRKCYAKMEEFFKAGKTIIYVSHDANSVNQLCNRAVLIHEGRIIMDAEPKEVTKFYEKMLFSSENKLDKVIREIKIANQDVKAVDSKAVEVAGNRVQPALVEEGYFIPGLVPKSILIYEHESITISDLRVETMAGIQVNVLSPGCKYQYKYRVKFTSKFDKIAFGLKIKSELGVQLVGNSTHFSSAFHYVRPGEWCDVSWEFECNLLRGLYYFNAGVSQMFGEEPVILARIVDGLVFKVAQPVNIIERGITHLKTACSVSQYRSEQETHDQLSQ